MGTYFKALENIPRSSLIVSIHADVTLDISAISYSGFSEMTHDHASMPADMAAGLNASKGSATI